MFRRLLARVFTLLRSPIQVAGVNVSATGTYAVEYLVEMTEVAVGVGLYEERTSMGYVDFPAIDNQSVSVARSRAPMVLVADRTWVTFGDISPLGPGVADVSVIR